MGEKSCTPSNGIAANSAWFIVCTLMVCHHTSLVASGFEPILDSGPAATRRFIAEELARWTPIIKATGFKME